MLADCVVLVVLRSQCVPATHQTDTQHNNEDRACKHELPHSKDWMIPLMLRIHASSVDSLGIRSLAMKFLMLGLG